MLAPPGEATYAATKHGVLGYLKTVRSELRRSAIELTVIMPAVVDTALVAGTAAGAAGLLQPADVAAAVVKAVRRPRFHVTVPAYIDPLYRAINVLPRWPREMLLRQLVPNQIHQGRSKRPRRLRGPIHRAGAGCTHRSPVMTAALVLRPHQRGPVPMLSHSNSDSVAFPHHGYA